MENPSVRSLANVPLFFTDLGTFSADVDRGMFRPLLLVSYALNHSLGEYDVLGYRLINILIHAVNACVVAWLTMLLCPRRRDAAFIAGLLFVAHPAGDRAGKLHKQSERESGSHVLFVDARPVHPCQQA